MTRTRLLLAALLAPPAPLVVLYLVSLALDGPAPGSGTEAARVSVLAIPGLLLAYPWAWLGGAPLVWWLRRSGRDGWLGCGLAGLALGGLPAIALARAISADVAVTVGVYATFGVIAALAYRLLAGAAAGRSSAASQERR